MAGVIKGVGLKEATCQSVGVICPQNPGTALGNLTVQACSLEMIPFAGASGRLFRTPGQCRSVTRERSELRRPHSLKEVSDFNRLLWSFVGILGEQTERE
ncbi:hypothetical protein [Streptomyces abikoensis]|uniref:hypothetical protein n=1 Tax=Streptomyces abikoensis TaxID=97398 RepID=UPI001E2BFFD4|nr:hypothetical protein [Streptomyces abikoensis]